MNLHVKFKVFRYSYLLSIVILVYEPCFKLSRSAKIELNSLRLGSVILGIVSYDTGNLAVLVSSAESVDTAARSDLALRRASL